MLQQLYHVSNFTRVHKCGILQIVIFSPSKKFADIEYCAYASIMYRGGRCFFFCYSFFLLRKLFCHYTFIVVVDSSRYCICRNKQHMFIAIRNTVLGYNLQVLVLCDFPSNSNKWSTNRAPSTYYYTFIATNEFLYGGSSLCKRSKGSCVVVVSACMLGKLTFITTFNQ